MEDPPAELSAASPGSPMDDTVLLDVVTSPVEPPAVEPPAEEAGPADAPEPSEMTEMEVGTVGVAHNEPQAVSPPPAVTGAVREEQPAEAQPEPPAEQLVRLMQECEKRQRLELKRLIWVYRFIVGLDPLSGRLIDAEKLDDVSDDDEPVRLSMSARQIPIKPEAVRKLTMLYQQMPKRKDADLAEIARQLRTPEKLVRQFFNQASRSRPLLGGQASFPKKRPSLKHPLDPPGRATLTKRAKPDQPKAKKPELSAIETSIRSFLNRDGGLRDPVSALNFMNVVRGEVSPKDRPVVLNCVAETESISCLRKLVQCGLLQLLNKWMVDAKATGSTVVTRMVLRVLCLIPMTLEGMQKSGIGKTVKRLEKDSEKDTIQRAKHLVTAWSRFIPAKGDEAPGEIVPGDLPGNKRPRPQPTLEPVAKKPAVEKPQQKPDDGDMFASKPREVDLKPIGTGGGADSGAGRFRAGYRASAPAHRRDHSSAPMSADHIKQMKDRARFIKDESVQLQPAAKIPSPRESRPVQLQPKETLWSGGYEIGADHPQREAPTRARKIRWAEGAALKTVRTYSPFQEEWPKWGLGVASTEELRRREKREEKAAKAALKRQGFPDDMAPWQPPVDSSMGAHAFSVSVDGLSKQMEPATTWAPPTEVEIPESCVHELEFQSTEKQAQASRCRTTPMFNYSVGLSEMVIQEPPADQTLSLDALTKEFPVTEVGENGEAFPQPPGAIPPPPPSMGMGGPPPPPPSMGMGGPLPPPPPAPEPPKGANPQLLLSLLTQMQQSSGSNMEDLLVSAASRMGGGSGMPPTVQLQPTGGMMPGAQNVMPHPPAGLPPAAAGSGNAEADLLKTLLNAVAKPGPAASQGVAGGNPFANVKAGGIAPMTMAPSAATLENKPWNYKSKACMFYQKDGRCRNGANCLYYHDESERRFPQPRHHQNYNN